MIFSNLFNRKSESPAPSQLYLEFSVSCTFHSLHKSTANERNCDRYESGRLLWPIPGGDSAFCANDCSTKLELETQVYNSNEFWILIQLPPLTCLLIQLPVLISVFFRILLLIIV